MLMNKLKQYWQLLEGKRTYILGVVTTVLNVVLVLYPNILTSAQLLKVDGVLVALGGMAIRSAISRQ